MNINIGSYLQFVGINDTIIVATLKKSGIKVVLLAEFDGVIL